MKKTFLLIIALWMAVSAQAALKGDVNGDGEVSIADVTTLVNLVLNQSSNGTSDVNGDGETGVADVTMLVSILMNQGGEVAGRVVGGDISLLPTYEEHQAAQLRAWSGSPTGYYDVDGNRIDDVITFVKQQGWTAARVRLFVDPSKASAEHVGQGVRQSLEYITPLCTRIKAAGLRLMLDFHYSDSWADPVQQYTPAAWVGLNDYQLTNKIYEYTKQCLETLKAANATPDYIQTGNEISYGMLWGPKGGTLMKCYSGDDTNWPRFISLLKSAGKACREVCPNAKIILHNERVAKPELLYNFYTKLSGVDYDIIGLSYYPYYHGLLPNLNNVLTQLESVYKGKRIMIVETGYAHRYGIDGDYSSQATAVWPISTAGQKKFVTDLVSTLRQHDAVDGLFWWFPEANEYGLDWTNYRVTDSWYNGNLWSHETGRATPALYELKTFLNE